MSKKADETPAWKLERIAIGELERTSDAQQDRLDALHASDRDILQAMPVDSVVQEVERRRRLIDSATVPKTRPWRLAALGAMAAAAAAVVLVPRITSQRSEQANAIASNNTDGDPYTVPGSERVKGDERLLISVLRGGNQAELEHGGYATAGDVLQLSYLAAGQRFGMVFSIDGVGTVTQHLPEAGYEAATLSPRGRTPLPTSYELDDAPEFERFYLITSKKPFGLRKILSSAEALRNDGQKLSLADGLRQHIFTVRKLEQ